MLLVTAREHDIVYSMVDGLRPAAIAARLGISIKTVSTLRSRLMKRNGLKTDTQVGYIVALSGMTLTHAARSNEVDYIGLARKHNEQALTNWNIRGEAK